MPMPDDQVSEDPMREVTPLLIDVQCNLDRDISLESLARQSGYSPFHFHRFFSSAVGETPKQHVHRLRLERAAYKLAITSETVLRIALSVGFKNHETFSRAFKRAFGYTPSDYRRACQAAQAERLERNRGFRGEGCILSEVRFVSLPATTLLAIRRHGAYTDCPLPFQQGDELWSDLVAWAKRKEIAYHPVPLAISYDDPTVTPSALQRLDACIPIDADVTGEGRIRRLDFAGGQYGAIDHAGPLSTIDQAYRNLADGIRRSNLYVFDEAPPVQIYRKIHVGGDPMASLTEVCFPVRTAR
jgi:AraC family transcriptional regulator